MAPFSGSLARTRALVRQALREETSPRKVAMALALGAFVGASPLLGLQSILAIGVATALRLNRVLSFVGSNVSFGPMMPALIWLEILVGRKVLGGDMPAFATDRIVTLAKDAVAAWWVGWGIIGPALAAICGAIGFFLARVRAFAPWTPPRGVRSGARAECRRKRRPGADQPRRPSSRHRRMRSGHGSPPLFLPLHSARRNARVT